MIKENDRFTDNLLPATLRQGVCCTYLLLCRDGTLYCGWTNDLVKRLNSHNQGTGGKYTASRRPVRLVWAECFPTRQEAMKREWQIKHMTRKQKLSLLDKNGEREER